MPHPAIATEDRQEKGTEQRELTGSEILLRCLIREGVDTIFGYPGGAVLPIYDSLYHEEIRHVLARHEQGAIHMAEGYARVTGKPGVVIATSGPGATNLVTGIANAQMDSIPLVCITGNVPQNLIGTDAFQEADITGITMPITKHNYFVTDVRDLARVVKEAFVIASTGRPGPVLIDIPKDVSNAKTSLEFRKRSSSGVISRPPIPIPFRFRSCTQPFPKRRGRSSSPGAEWSRRGPIRS